MRILVIHVSEVKFWAVTEAIENPPDPPSQFEGRDCVVGFVSVEEGDSMELVEQAALEIAEHARRSGVSCVVVYPFAHLSPSLAPPEVASPILRAIEARLREMGLQTTRAPFGWYKGFTITCPGHPACELSRTITAPKGPWYMADGRKKLVKDAISSGLLPSELEQGNPWDNEALGSMGKMGLTSDGLTPSGEVMVESLASWASERLGNAYPESRPGGPSEIYGVSGLVSILRSCLDAGRYLSEGSLRLRSPFPGADLILTAYDAGDEGIVKAISEVSDEAARNLTWIVSSSSSGLSISYDVQYSARIASYMTRARGLAVLAMHGSVRGNQITCLGPLRLIASAAIDAGLRLAEAGRTPSLPFWMAPLQVAVIPVKEGHVDYAREVLSELTSVGARAYLDPPTKSLGARIRSAGRAWVPIIVVMGDREVASRTVSVRRRWREGEQEVLELDDLVVEVRQLVASSPGRVLRPPAE
ncbi:MAG: threonyl-tRNA synthetase editing domain-containing protein [Acidilobus sp.]